MRDESIFEMQKQQARRVAIIYRQLQFLDSRMLAYEKVLSSTWNKLRALFSRKWMMAQVEKEQLEILRIHDEQIKEASEKAQEEKAKPKLTIVGANGISKLCLLFTVSVFASGCVSLKTHRLAMKECALVQGNLRNEINAKTDRLRRFNQINEDGSLRTKRNDDSKGWDQNDGSNDEQ